MVFGIKKIEGNFTEERDGNMGKELLDFKERRKTL